MFSLDKNVIFQEKVVNDEITNASRIFRKSLDFGLIGVF